MPIENSDLKLVTDMKCLSCPVVGRKRTCLLCPSTGHGPPHNRQRQLRRVGQRGGHSPLRQPTACWGAQHTIENIVVHCGGSVESQRHAGFLAIFTFNAIDIQSPKTPVTPKIQHACPSFEFSKPDHRETSLQVPLTIGQLTDKNRRRRS